MFAKISDFVVSCIAYAFLRLGMLLNMDGMDDRERLETPTGDTRAIDGFIFFVSICILVWLLLGGAE